MPYPPILRDSQGSPIPQIWDGANWKPYRANTPLVTTHQNAAAANGNGVAADVDGYGSAMFQVTGTFSATVNFEGSVDGVTFVPIFVIDSNGNRVATTTSTGIFKADIAGLKSIRARISNYVSGSVTVVSRALPMARPTEQSVLLNGSNAATETLGSGVTIAAGAYQAYDNVDTRRAAYIISGFREINGIAHPNRMTVNWRAIYGQISTATIAETNVVPSGTRVTGGALIAVKGEAVQVVLLNEDTVSHTYNIWITRRAV